MSVDDSSPIGIIEKEYTIDPTRTKLPPGFVWKNIDIDDDAQLDKLYVFLKNHYTHTDDDAQLEYSKDFIRWTLKVPFEYYPLFSKNITLKECCIAVCAKNGNICGFISGVPVTLCINGKELRTAQVNFLCVHLKVRDKRLAPILTKELMRLGRCIKSNNCIFMGPLSFPFSPVIKVNYYHRSLNIQNLIVQHTIIY